MSSFQTFDPMFPFVDMMMMIRYSLQTTPPNNSTLHVHYNVPPLHFYFLSRTWLLILLSWTAVLTIETKRARYWIVLICTYELEESKGSKRYADVPHRTVEEKPKIGFDWFSLVRFHSLVFIGNNNSNNNERTFVATSDSDLFVRFRICATRKHKELVERQP